MAVLIGFWELILALGILVCLTVLASSWFWRRRMAVFHEVIDKRHQAELVALHEAHDRQQQAEVRDMIREFRHQASHCLRPIKDNLHLIKRETQVPAVAKTTEWPQAVAASLKEIAIYEWRLTRLIENLTFVSNLEARDFGLRFAEVKLDAIVSDVVSDFQNSAKEEGIGLAWWARPENLRLMADQDGLRQVFINLIDNAIKYCGEGDEIDVALEANGDKKLLRARVSDTGPGIPEEDWDSIFHKGYTVEGARGRPPRQGGQGLGLYIVKLVVEKHKGRVEVTSKLGKGTTFIITLPMRRI